MALKLTGTDNVLRNLNKEILKIKGRTKAGLRQAALLVRRESQLNTPVDIGNLKASAYTEVQDTPSGAGAEIGYTAFYAPFVHEMLEVHRGEPRTGTGAKGNYWDPGGRAGRKFLERALKDNEKLILKIIKTSAVIR